MHRFRSMKKKKKEKKKGGARRGRQLVYARRVIKRNEKEANAKRWQRFLEEIKRKRGENGSTLSTRIRKGVGEKAVLLLIWRGRRKKERKGNCCLKMTEREEDKNIDLALHKRARGKRGPALNNVRRKKKETTFLSPITNEGRKGAKLKGARTSL